MKRHAARLSIAFSIVLNISSAMAFNPSSSAMFEFDSVDYLSLDITQACTFDAEMLSRYKIYRKSNQAYNHAIDFRAVPQGHDTCSALVEQLCETFGFNGTPLLLSFFRMHNEYRSEDGRMLQDGLVSKFICRHQN